MSITKFKPALWLAAALTGGYLAWYVASFLLHMEDLKEQVSREEQYKALDGARKPEPPKDNLVEYDRVKRVFFDLPWTGKETKVEVSGAGPKVDDTPKYKPVKDLLKVLFIQVDTTDAKQGLALVKFSDPQLAAAAKHYEDSVLHTGERLAAPYTGIHVVSIAPDGVHFGFDDAAREMEVLPPLAFPNGRGIVKVGEGGVILPEARAAIPRSAGAPVWKPKTTTQLDAAGKRFAVGTEDLREMERDYARILSQDVSYRSYRNPRNGQLEGIELTRVKPDSIPARAGLSEGEVLISINGHPVTSVNDAIQYVKKEASNTSRWEAVFEKNGRRFTRVYESPEE
jgi:hypothetical protein